MSPKRAALGFKLHTGWAAVVTATRTTGHVEVLLRRRIELLPPDGSVSRFVYHEAAELSPAEGRKLVKRTAQTAQASASKALSVILDELRTSGISIGAAGIAIGSTTVPSDFASILKAHTHIHAAEGLLYQDAVADACDGCGLKVSRMRERDLWGKLGLQTQQEVESLRGLIGPPWGADQKAATAAALAALDVAGTSRVTAR